MKKALLIAALCTTLTGCIDQSYDLFEVDTTVQLGNEASKNVFPVDFEKEILLKEVIKQKGSIRHITTKDTKEHFALVVENGKMESGRQSIVLKLPAVGAKVTKEQVGGIDPVELGGMPEFLSHPDVCFDVENPALLLDVDNHVPSEIKTRATLTALNEYMEPIMVNGHVAHMEIDLDVPAGTDQKLYLADQQLSWLPDFMEGYEYHADHDIADMVRRIPHYIRVEIGDVDVVDADDHMDPSRFYEVNVNFGIYIPIKYRKDFHLIYDWKQEDLIDAIDDLEDVEIRNVSLEGEVESNLPLDLELEFTPLNDYGEVIPGLSAESSRSTYRPGDADHHFVLTIVSTDPELGIIDYVNSLDPETHLSKVALRAHVRAGQNPSALLYTDTYIRLKNTKVSVTGPIIIHE